MKIYLAGEGGKDDRWLEHCERRLMSYFYHGARCNNVVTQDTLKTHELGIEMFLDSGAYSCFTQGVDINVEMFAAYIHKTKDMWTVISSLDDTTKNEQKSYDNLKALESLGVEVAPVFHARENPEWLVKYLDEGYDYIFLGGMVPESTAWLREWLDDLFLRYLLKPNGSPRVKIHGFGLTDQALMFRYPWHSVDSTSWLMKSIYGKCAFIVNGKMQEIIFSDEHPDIKKLGGRHYATLPKVMRAEIDKWLEPFGVTAEECANWYGTRHLVNAQTFQAMESLGVKKFTAAKQDTLFE